MQETTLPTSHLLVLNEEQELLKSSARDFFKEKSPVSALRTLRDTRNEKGFDPQLWQQMAEMGWAGMVIPEAYGGLDFGYLGMGIVLEEAARTLIASPLISTALVSATALRLGGSEAQKERFLPDIAEGNLLMSLALEEGKHHNPLKISTEARQEGSYFILNGSKTFVIDGHIADQFIIAARSSQKPGDSQGISLFVVDAQAEGLQIRRTISLDSRNYADIQIQGLKVSADALLGELGQGYELLQTVLDISNIHLAAELSGLMQEAFERTMAYLKERKQFGVPIGSFQGLQHRAADLYCHIEMCQSVVRKALMAIDAQANNLPLLASLAKAKTCETVKRVTNEAIQMFGGIGVTDDEEIGFFLKRARAVQMTFGDYAYHLDRFASLQGY
ncbi:MAG: acyl-CoA dehydrogenase [Microscillaceae bacterium]|nr:acyl-CoA dehydrogenase [Microscillaceae bacterium]